MLLLLHQSSWPCRLPGQYVYKTVKSCHYVCLIDHLATGRGYVSFIYVLLLVLWVGSDNYCFFFFSLLRVWCDHCQPKYTKIFNVKLFAIFTSSSPTFSRTKPFYSRFLARVRVFFVLHFIIIVLLIRQMYICLYKTIKRNDKMNKTWEFCLRYTQLINAFVWGDNDFCNIKSYLISWRHIPNNCTYI